MCNALEADKDFIAIQIIKDISVNLVSHLQSQDPEQLVKDFDKLQQAVGLMKEVSEMYSAWNNDFYKAFLDMFMSHGLFEPDELTPEKINPNFFIELDKSTKYMQSYKYKTGRGSLDGIETAGLRLGNDILIMEDVNQFFGYLKNTDQDDDVVYAHIILKIEERIDLSHFVVAIIYNGHSFISTDAPSFATPQNKYSTRNARRHMELKYDNLAFPYILIDQIPDIRKENTSVAAYGAYSLELYKKPIKDFDAYCKLFLIGISDKLRKDARTIKKDVMLLSDYVETKLIGEPLDIKDEDHDLFLGHKEKHKNQLAEIVGTLDEEETGLIKVGSEMVLASDYYDKNWLATPEDLEKLSKWLALDTKKHDLQAKLNDKFGTIKVKDDAIEWIGRELNKEGNFERLWPFIFSGDDVHYEITDKFDREYDEDGNRLSNNHIGHDNAIEESKVVSLFNDKNHWYTMANLGFDRFDGLRERSANWKNKGNRSYDDYLWRDNCDCCGKVRNKVVKYFRILHWKQLCFLLDVKREELPAYLRVYKADQLIPYYGNEITSEVHPLSTVKHPSWKEFKSGITCTVHMCKKCANKLEKKYKVAGESLIKTDGSVVELPDGTHSLRYMQAF